MSRPILNAAQSMHRQSQVSTVRNSAETHACASSARTQPLGGFNPPTPTTTARVAHRQVTLTLRGSHPFPASCNTATLHSTRVRATKIPDYNEDRDAAHSAFVSAFDAAKPGSTKIAGLQEFAGSIWERRRRIPSQLYNDPLTHLFQEFDLDDDGSLTAAEISQALVSRGVRITPEQVQVFIEAADSNSNHTIEQHEFADLIFHMASADLNRDHHAPSPSSEDDPL